MNKKHHWKISNRLKFQWCFCFLIIILNACKSTKIKTLEAKNDGQKISIIEYDVIKKDSFLQINQPECNIKSVIYEVGENKKTNITFKNKLKNIALEIPQIVENKAYDDGRLLDGFSIASVIFGLLGIPFLGYILGPIAIILGTISLFRTGKHKSRTGKGYAIAGIILGIIAIGASFVIKNL